MVEGAASCGRGSARLADDPPHSAGAVDDRVDAAIEWADAAIALVTADARSPNGAPNVMDEIGRWRGRKGKETLCIVRQESVLPYSNHSGIVFVGFKARVEEAFEKIRHFLATVGGQQPGASPAATGTTANFVVEDSRDLALIDNQAFPLTGVIESGADIVLELGPLSAQKIAALRQLSSQGEMTVAFQDTAILAQLTSKKIERRDSDTVATLTLRDSRREYGGASAEVAWGGSPSLDADQIARLRASRILFNDPPPVNDRDLGSIMGPEMLIKGGGGFGLQVKESPLRAALAQLPAEHETTWKLVRLLLIQYLRLSNCVEHVTLLRLTVRGGALVRVEFSGVRRRKYTNQSAAVIELDRQL